MIYNLYKVGDPDELATVGRIVNLKVGKSAVILPSSPVEVQCLDEYGWITSVVKDIRYKGQVMEFDTLNSTYRLEPVAEEIH